MSDMERGRLISQHGASSQVVANYDRQVSEREHAEALLGEGHVGCPGRGKPAPAMMQQIKGMKGCVPNVWPYDAKGRLITGPAVP